VTFRKARACKELTVRTVFDNHITSAVLADYIRLLIFYLDAFKILFRLFDSFVKVRIKVLDYSFPLDTSILNLIKKHFHIGSKTYIHNGRERFLHYRINCFSKFCYKEILLFLNNIMSGNDCSDSRCISRWSSNSLLLKCFNKGSLCKMSRRLCKMLLLIIFLKFND